MAEVELLVEPKRYKRTVTVRREPLFLVNAVCRVAFGWWMEAATWKPLAGGRWSVRLCWQRRRDCRYPETIGDHTKLVWYRYQRMRIGTTLRVLWLFLWSKPYREKGERETDG